ncbi:MAG: serine/threonine-protein kinase, partial [Vicinamibacteria bacterium]
MSGASQRLDGLAERVLESGAVDWLAELDAASADERELILALRDIARVAEVSRMLERPGQALGDSAAPTVEREAVLVAGGFPKRWGHLEITEKVGAGASATVFRARDTHLNRDTALKLFHFASPARPEIRRALMEEGRNLAQVKHSNVVTVYGADEHEGRVALWMEFVDGETIQALMSKRGPLSAEEAASIGSDLCDALTAVHAQGLIHGDVKAANVMRESGGRVVLMDFSTSRAARTGDGSPGRPVGTPLYMAPELFRGDKASVRSDVYSLGVLLYYMVTGTYPVRANTAEELREAHQRGKQVLLSDARPDLPDDLVAAVERSLVPDPERRLQSAEALKTALPSTEKTAPSIWRRVLSWTGALGAVVVSLTFLGFATSMNFNVTLWVPPEFVSESLLDYFIWGVRAMIPAAYYLWDSIEPVIVVLLGATVFILLSRRWTLRDVVNQLARKRRQLLDRLDPIAIAVVYFLLGTCSIVVLGWMFHDVNEAMDRVFSSTSMIGVDLSALSPDFASQHILRTRLYALLLFLLALLAAIVFPYLRARMIPNSVRLMKGATILMILVAAVMMVMPYRLLWHTELERVTFEGRAAFVVARKAPELFLY